MSDTGYIRLSITELHGISLVHLVSGMDEDGDGAQTGAVPTAITGYTEWVSTDSPAITLGWDWQMLSEQRCILLKRVSSPSSNVMLQNANRTDLGHIHTALLLEHFIDGIAWQSKALEFINVRYVC
jgi:hypothetical protein